MRRVLTLTLTCALAAGCALSPAQAQRTAAPAAAIEDAEPDVTKEVAAALARQGANAERAGEAEASLLRACPAPLQLELLRRSTDGEERSYVYRVRCPAPLLATATYGKNAAIKRLTVLAEPAGYAPGR